MEPGRLRMHLRRPKPPPHPAGGYSWGHGPAGVRRPLHGALRPGRLEAHAGPLQQERGVSAGLEPLRYSVGGLVTVIPSIVQDTRPCLSPVPEIRMLDRKRVV